MTPTRKTEAKKHTVAFYSKEGPIDVLNTIKRLRQIRHGLENSPDKSEALSHARNSVDQAITLLGEHDFIFGNHHEDDVPTEKPGELEAKT